MAARSLERLQSLFLAPGYSTEYMHNFLATGLFPDRLEMDDNEFIQVEKYPIKEVYAMFDRGEIIDGKSIALLAILRQRLTG